MNYTMLKTGPVSLFPASTRTLTVDEGDEIELSGPEAAILVEHGWAKKSEAPVVQDEDKDENKDEDKSGEIEKTLLDLIGAEKSEKDKKNALQKWGEENIGEKVSKANKVSKMISELCSKFLAKG